MRIRPAPVIHRPSAIDQPPGEAPQADGPGRALASGEVRTGPSDLGLVARSEELIGADGLAAVGGGDGVPRDVVDGALDELDRAVAEQHVHPARVLRAG